MSETPSNILKNGLILDHCLKDLTPKIFSTD